MTIPDDTIADAFGPGSIANKMTPMDEIVWARDLDGTGSLHMCSPGDPGAVAYATADIDLVAAHRLDARENDQLRDTIATLRAEIARLTGTAVKLLEWQQNGRAENDIWTDHLLGVGLYYTISPESNVFRVEWCISGDEWGSQGMGLYGTLEAAKAAVDIDFAARLMPHFRGPL